MIIIISPNLHSNNNYTLRKSAMLLLHCLTIGDFTYYVSIYRYKLSNYVVFSIFFTKVPIYEYLFNNYINSNVYVGYAPI